ncbi:MAG TPA: NYN domain-containing protein [Gemmatimonadaceae bacterium]
MTAAPHVSAPVHAPNAALLIDFDNVTMGIRSDLGKELRNLLSSEIIKGKVAVQRAYADWRRYPQYVVSLAESSIDMIMAPAYGSSKKNATDIRLAIDGLELVFTRPEIGTFILLSGDSDFSSLVMKLKEYGKYVIGVGIRESSSDLLVQNCDEYYSYNALAGLIKASDEEPSRKYDPWELVTEAVQRMKRNNDVMRSDRLKQVMQEIDSTFDEKNLGISKFSRFCQEAAQKGLLSVTKLDNGQLEVDLPNATPATETRTMRGESPAPSDTTETGAAGEDRGPRRSRRGRGGGRGREREPRIAAASPAPTTRESETPASTPLVQPAAQLEFAAESRPAGDGAGSNGERLTRSEAFDLVRRAVNELVSGDESVRASEVRLRARQLLGRDSESLSDRMFVRILKDAHDEGLIDLRRRGNDFEVARAAEAAPVSEQLARHETAATTASTPAIVPAAPRLGMGPRGARARGAGPLRGRPGAPPPELLSIGVVEEDVPVVIPAAREAHAASTDNGAAPSPRGKRGRGPRGRGKTGRATPAASAAAVTAAAPPAPAPAKAKRGRAVAKTGGPRAKKRAPAADQE